METCPRWLQEKLAKEPRFALYAAKDPSTPTFILEALAQLPSAKVRAALSVNPNLSAATLLKLCKFNIWALLQNPLWPILLLQDPNLFTQISPWALSRAIKTSTLPRNLFPLLCTHKDQSVRAEIARHPMTPAHLLEHLSYHPDRVVRLAVIENPTVTQDTLTRLLHDTDSYVALNATLKHPETSIAELCRLAESKDQHTRRLLLSCPRYPKEHHQLLQRAGATAELALPIHPNKSIGYLSPAEFEALSTGSDFALQLIAKHPLTPPATLARLAELYNRETNQALMQRPDLTTPLLRQIMHNGGWRYELVYQKSVSKEALALFVESSNWVHREMVAARLDLSSEQLSKLLYDEQRAVQEMALRNLKATAEHLAGFAKHADSKLRRLVAKHPNTPTSALVALLGDGRAEVRAAAANNPKTPAAVLATYLRAGSTREFDRIDASRLRKPRIKQRERELLQETVFGRLLLEATFSYEARLVWRKQRQSEHQHKRTYSRRDEKKDHRGFGVKRK